MTSNWEPTANIPRLRCWAELDGDALRLNVSAARQHARGAAVMAVVKANAYGHGLSGVVRAVAGDVEMFGVANLGEARAVRETLLGCAGAEKTPVFLLGTVLPAEREAVVAEGFVAAISSAEEAAAFGQHGHARLHLAIDTGMGRMGAGEDDALGVAKAISTMPNVEMAGIWSHLPVADEDDVYTAEQLGRFHRVAKTIAASISPAPLIHVQNSAGAIGFPTEAGNLIRLGLALYGLSPRPEFQSRLRPALTWKTRVLLARHFGAGRSVSYGRDFITDRPMRIATLGVGYADGYQRQVSGKGAHVLIRGRRCALLGRVTMDQIMVDISALPDVEPGEEVVLLGRQGPEEIPASTFAAWAGTIPWHVFTSLGTRVARVEAAESSPFQNAKPQ